MAVLFQRPTGQIRAYVFRIMQRMPQESSITHAKTGEQISIPVRFPRAAGHHGRHREPAVLHDLRPDGFVGRGELHSGQT